MANLNETQQFDAVYQLETTDEVVAGPGGKSNVQAQQLTNRTAWLKQQLEILLAATNTHANVAASEGTAGHVMLATALEALAGIVANKAITPAGLKAVMDHLTNGAPAAMDQLNEFAAALGNDANFAATMTTLLAAKAPLNAPPLVNPTMTTQLPGDNSTKGASTAFVHGELAANLFGFRNCLINGNFAINQRGYVSGTNTTGNNQYTLDRWRVAIAGQNLTYTPSGVGRQVTAPANGLVQIIEGRNIEGGIYTLSWTGTASAWVNGAEIINGGQTAPLPANVDVTVTLLDGTVSTVQLEKGDFATPFELRHFGVELLLCQRYYEKSYAIDVAPGSTTDGNICSTTHSGGGGDYYYWQIRYKVTKRIAVTVTTYDSGTGQANRVMAGGASNVTPVIDYAGINGFQAGAFGGANSRGDMHWTVDCEM